MATRLFMTVAWGSSVYSIQIVGQFNLKNEGEKMFKSKICFVVASLCVALAPTRSVSASSQGAPNPATAHSCNGATCRGQDPNITGCSQGAVNLTVRKLGGVRIELRYSARCNAKWARVTNLAGGQSPWTLAALSPWHDSVNVIQQKRVVWSKMWSGKGIAACGAASPDSQ